MLKRTITICLAVAALGSGLAACGGGSVGQPPAAAAEPPATRRDRSVDEDDSFTPADLKVAPGEEVTFTNDGAIAHTATAGEGADFDSGSVAPGETFTFTAGDAGP